MYGVTVIVTIKVCHHKKLNAILNFILGSMNLDAGSFRSVNIFFNEYVRSHYKLCLKKEIHLGNIIR